MPAERLMRSAIRWLPALALMSIIFLLSSIPGSEIPYFGAWDFVVKKAAHSIGFGLLGVSYYHALSPGLPRGARWGLAWVMALGFALSDEFHQSFVAGRTPAPRDVGYDILGATLFLIWGAGYSPPSSERSRS
jgi:hypothetical protein